MLTQDFQALRITDVALVGGKNAGLGELLHALEGTSAQVPPGFAITAEAYWAFLDHGDLRPFLQAQLSDLDPTNIASLQQRGHAIRTRLSGAPLPPPLEQEIREQLARLGPGPVAVRSSATAEDLPEASFAGQQDSFLDVRGADEVLTAVRRCFASLFTDRAISYRARHGFDHLDVALSVAVQRMVDAVTSGVMFTLDPDTGVREVLHIDAIRGLGDALVSGKANPDQYKVFAPLVDDFEPLLERRPGFDGASFVLTMAQTMELARVGVAIQRHFGRPMDIEWAYGSEGVLQVLQARPETVHARKGPPGLRRTVLEEHGERLLSGIAVGAGIGAGPARVLARSDELSSFREGDVLVANRTDPDWEPAMRKASAVVTETGGRTCHAAIVCRELGVPAVVGAAGATSVLSTGEVVTVSCAEGYEGHIYRGRGAWREEVEEASSSEKSPVDLMVNVANPFDAWRAALLPVTGVGLMRIEFIVGSTIGVHPRALLELDAVPDPAVRQEILQRCAPYGEPSRYFVEKLASGIAQVGAAFWPRPVTVRLSDFKTNEYRTLLGGETFEPAEANPMIGWRGASRYIDPAFREAFALECRALRRVRDEMGLTNVRIMVPFCRTLGEADAVLARLAEEGLARGANGLQVYVMVEVPSNAVLAEEFAERFDGFSIGSNDLTQLTLGADRDGERLASVFDEEDAAVRALIRMAIQGAHARGIPVGICGQGPSDRPAFARWLMSQGIDTISLTPDSVMPTRQRLAQTGSDEAAAW